MKTIKITIACVMLAAAGFIISCSKSNTTTPAASTDTDVSGANDNVYAQNTSNDIAQIGAEATDNNGGTTNYRMSPSDAEESITSCATVTWNTGASTVTVQFNGDTCLDGRVRTGTIVFNYSGSPAGAHYRTPGFTYTASSNNYTVDGNQVSFTHTVLNTTPAGFDSATVDETWNITTTVTIIKNNGDTINWTGDHVKTLLNTVVVYNGPNIPITWSDARVGITGNEYGSRSGGETFTTNITSQLVRDFGSCRIHGRVPFILGKFTLTLSDKKYPRYVDYGPGAPNSGTNGACDLWATVTINSNVYYVQLP